jgi:hypothetical protein
MNMPDNLYGPQQRSVGNVEAPHGWGQLPTLNKPQQAAQYAMLARGLGSLFQQQPSFEPIKNEYMRAYREQNLPGLMSNFTGNMNGSDYQRAVAQGDIDLATRLAGLQANFQQHQFDKNREFGSNLLKLGMAPSFENMYSTIPYAEAEKHLKRQGIENPTVAQVNKAVSQFEAPKPLGFNDVRNFAQTVRGSVQDVAKAYQEGAARQEGGGILGGIKGAAGNIWNQAENALSGSGPQLGEPTGELTDVGEKYLGSNKAAQEAVDKSSRGATPEQKEIINDVVSKIAAEYPNAKILEQRLAPEDYQKLDAITNSPNEKVQKIVPLLKTKKDLDELSHHVDRGSKLLLKGFLWKMLRHATREEKAAHKEEQKQQKRQKYMKKVAEQDRKRAEKRAKKENR